jgi:hypothetical protein
MALSSILGTWLDHFFEDFCAPPHFPCLKLLLNYLVVYIPGSEGEVQLFHLLNQWEDMEPSEMEGKSEKPGNRGQKAHKEGCVHSPNVCTFPVWHWSRSKNELQGLDHSLEGCPAVGSGL